jgi:hypothetical protein
LQADAKIGATTFSIMALSKKTVSTTGFIQTNISASVIFSYSYAECRFVECLCGVIILNVILQCVIKQSVVALVVYMISFIILSVFMFAF